MRVDNDLLRAAPRVRSFAGKAIDYALIGASLIALGILIGIAMHGNP